MKNVISIVKLFLAALVFSSCNQVINKLAFHPDKLDIYSAGNLPENVEEIYFETEDKVRIQSFFVSDKSSEKLVIYFHGNAGNISHRIPELLHLGSFGVNVLGVGYRGYGKSEGKPTEKGIYLDGKAALDYAINKLGFSLSNIVIFGRSIGTTVALDISQNLKIAGVVLITPLSSGREYAKSIGLGFISFIAGDAFNNIDKISNVLAPILVIHGTEDNVVSIKMGKKVYKRGIGKKKLFIIEGAGHNNISTKYKDSYWPPIDEFIKQLK